MGDVKPFPTAPVHVRNAAALASWLREIADAIEADALETEPHAALVVLTGMVQHEIVTCGFKGDADGLHGAAMAVLGVGTATFRTISGNIRERVGGRYGRPLTAPNIVDGGRPKNRVLTLVDGT